MKDKTFEEKILEVCRGLKNGTTPLSAGKVWIKQLCDERARELFMKAIGEKKRRTYFGAIRCARCMQIPDMPEQKHCVDYENDKIDEATTRFEELLNENS